MQLGKGRARVWTRDTGLLAAWGFPRFQSARRLAQEGTGPPAAYQAHTCFLSSSHWGLQELQETKDP